MTKERKAQTKNNKSLESQVEFSREAIYKAHKASSFAASKKILGEALKGLARMRDDQN